jgi:DNA-binding transcriptional regulator of glucitol operon
MSKSVIRSLLKNGRVMPRWNLTLHISAYKRLLYKITDLHMSPGKHYQWMMIGKFMIQTICVKYTSAQKIVELGVKYWP